MRKVAGLALLVAGRQLYRRRRDATRDQVELHFEDGSAVTLESGSADGDVVLAVARRGL